MITEDDEVGIDVVGVADYFGVRVTHTQVSDVLDAERLGPVFDVVEFFSPPSLVFPRLDVDSGEFSLLVSTRVDDEAGVQPRIVTGYPDGFEAGFTDKHPQSAEGR